MSYGADTDKEFIAQAMPAFISEAAEQIEAIETLLLELEEQPDNRDLLDSLFRCAHTVKGSAGIFGLNRVVEFTHHVETLLDKMRDGAIALKPDISTLLLQCNDQIKFLVDTAADESADTPEQKDTPCRAGSPAACADRRASTRGGRQRCTDSSLGRHCNDRPSRLEHLGALWHGNLSQWHGPPVHRPLPLGHGPRGQRAQRSRHRPRPGQPIRINHHWLARIDTANLSKGENV